MPKFLELNEAYKSCEEKGFLSPQVNIDKSKIKANLIIAGEDIESANEAVKKGRWNSAYKLFYDVLHILVESYLCFDRVKSSNHQCLFACLCMKHSELEMGWEFFEKIRTKRNGINYYGQPVNNEDWKSVELQFKLYISSLRKEIEKKIRE